MDFSGTWKVYSEENLDEFLKAVDLIERFCYFFQDIKPAITIEQNGKDFTFTVKTPLRTCVNTVSIGKESEVIAVDGRKFKCTVREENGKLITDCEKFTSVREIQGEDMVEVSSLINLKKCNNSLSLI
uniref:Fatty acid binding protein 10b, liver basic n=1 Tax=Sphaeramia orbicularis TaxID=375764 RepID=A0A673AXI2_9TELE